MKLVNRLVIAGCLAFVVFAGGVALSRLAIFTYHRFDTALSEPVALVELKSTADVRREIGDDPRVNLYAVYYYRPGETAEAQKRILARLNGFYKGAVKFCAVDVSAVTPPEWIERPVIHDPKLVGRGLALYRPDRSPVVGLIFSCVWEFVELPASMEMVECKIDRLLDAQVRTTKYADEGGRGVPGWDFCPRDLRLIDLEVRVERVNLIAGQNHSMARITIDASKKTFVVDAWPDLKVGLRLRLRYFSDVADLQEIAVTAVESIHR